MQAISRMKSNYVLPIKNSEELNKRIKLVKELKIFHARTEANDAEHACINVVVLKNLRKKFKATCNRAGFDFMKVKGFNRYI